jgi:hypothetical protein
MTEPLYRLVYYSRNRLAHLDHAAAADISQILGASRKNNTEVGISGALMFNSGYFAQVLEGPQAAIEATFERIQQDPRHGDVSLLSFNPAERTFPKWSMAFVGRSAAGAATFGKIAAESGFDPSVLSGDRVCEILHDLLIKEELAA